MVNQSNKSLGLTMKVRIDYALLEHTYRRRQTDDSIKISKAFDANFNSPENPAEEKIKKLIDDYNEKRASKLEADLFKQRKRLADSERKLKEKETKKALEDQRISSTKIKWLINKISDLKRTELKPSDSRIFPMTYAPIIVSEKGEWVLKLARYHCRPEGKPESTDFKFYGLYNARSDNLGNTFWKPLFGKKHAFFIVESFFENVSKHKYEKRSLKSGEEEKNLVIHFNAPKRMLVACLYDYWGTEGKDGFYSFAAITGEPTKEVSDAGHDRLIIALKETNLDLWLNPQGHTLQEMTEILKNPEQFHYQYELAA